MSQFGIYILLIGITISITGTDETGREGKPVTIAMKAVFLNAYCKRVATYGYHGVDETKRREFMSTWEHILGRENAEEMLQNLEVHWTFAMDIVNKPIPDLTALVVTTAVRIMALKNGLSYLICILYYKHAKIDATPEHCRKRAAYLIIFSQLQIASLVPKLMKTRLYVKGFNNQSKDWLNLVSLLAVWKEIVRALQEVLVTFIEPTQKNYGDALKFETKQSGVVYEQVMSQVATILRLQYLSSFFAEKTLYLIMFGLTECTPYDLAHSVFGQWNRMIEMSLWNTALKIDTSGTEQNKRNMEKYFITDLIRENIVWRSKVNKFSRRDFIEQFEIMIPVKLEIWYENNGFNNSALSMYPIPYK